MPDLFIIAGPNGAGKTTAAHVLLRELLGPNGLYINADYIAVGMNPLRPELSAIAAGRVMLQKIQNAFSRNISFAFESTLSTRSFLRQLKESNYTVNIIYMWLQSPELAIERVAKRVAQGGHFVPTDTIKRRYYRSMTNFLELYAPLGKHWVVYDNSTAIYTLIAKKNGKVEIANNILWKKFQESAS